MTYTVLFPSAGEKTVSITCDNSTTNKTIRVYEVTGLNASESLVAVGSNVTFTASLTPAVTAENLVWNGPQIWLPVLLPPYLAPSPDLTGGFTKTFFFDNAGDQPVTVTCGTSSASKTIRVYAVTNVAASESLVPVGSNITFTAMLTGGTNPPSLTWYVNGTALTNTGITATLTFTNPADHTVSATCGTSSNNVAITAVGVKRIESLTPDALGVFAPSPLFVLKANAIQFRAIPDPTNAAWPPGMPTWQIEGSSLTNAEPSWSFQNQSASTNDTKLVIAQCGTSSGTNTVTVFSVSLVPEITVLANDYAGLAAADRVSRSVTRLDAAILPPVAGLRPTFSIDSANPNTGDKGRFVLLIAPGPITPPTIPFLATGGDTFFSTSSGAQYSIHYAAKLELSSHRDRELDDLKSQTVTINVSLNQVLAVSANVTVMGHFKWLMSKFRHQDALDFVNAKYSCGVSGPQYVPNFSFLGLVEILDDAQTGQTSGTVSVAKSALLKGENFTASALTHEQVHVSQGVVRRNLAWSGRLNWGALESLFGENAASYVLWPDRPAILAYLNCEIEAWCAELAAAAANGLDSDEISAVASGLEAYQTDFNAVSN